MYGFVQPYAQEKKISLMSNSMVSRRIWNTRTVIRLLRPNKRLGHPPFRFKYQHIRVDTDGETRSPILTQRNAPHEAPIRLSGLPGEHRYDILSVADQLYDFPNDRHAKQPEFTISQTVNSRPSARFHREAQLHYCVSDTFERHKGQSRVRFEGKPPFTIEYEIGRGGRHRGQVYSRSGIKSHDWYIEEPRYTFRDVGPHIVKILSMSDASGCQWNPPEDQDALYLSVNVVETASIVPESDQQDYCVGDSLEFRLQG